MCLNVYHAAYDTFMLGMEDSDGGGSAGAAIGGILGGIVLFAVIVAGVLFVMFYLRQRRKVYAAGVIASYTCESYICENKHVYSGIPFINSWMNLYVCIYSCVPLHVCDVWWKPDDFTNL